MNQCLTRILTATCYLLDLNREKQLDLFVCSYFFIRMTRVNLSVFVNEAEVQHNPKIILIWNTRSTTLDVSRIWNLLRLRLGLRQWHWLFESTGNWEMKLTPREVEKLGLHNAGYLAQKRLARGLRLNYTEAVAVIAAQVCLILNLPLCIYLNTCVS